MDFRGSLSPPRPPPPDLSTFALGPATPELQQGFQDAPNERSSRDRRRRSSMASSTTVAGAPPVIPIERDFDEGTRSTVPTPLIGPRGTMRRRGSSQRLGSGQNGRRVGEESRRCALPVLFARGPRSPRSVRTVFSTSAVLSGVQPVARASLMHSWPCRRRLHDYRLGRRYVTRAVKKAA